MNKMKIKYENGSITISTRVIYMINRTNIINYLSSSSISNELLNFHINNYNNNNNPESYTI